MQQSLRLAIIGKGRWSVKIKKTLETIPACEVAYEATYDWKHLLNKSLIDGVIIATPANTHADIAIPFIEIGIPVFIEKPMTSSLAEAIKIEELSKKFNTPIMVGHIHLYSPAFNSATKLLKECGKIKLIVGEGSATTSYKKGSSSLWEWAPHDLSMILSILNEEPESISASAQAVIQPGSKQWDNSQLVLNFPSSIQGLVHSSCLLPQRRRALTIIGEKKTIVYDDLLSEGKVALYEGIESIQQSPSNAVYPAYDKISSLESEMLDFLDIIRTGKKAKSDEKLGVAIIKILDAAERSIASGGKIVNLN